MHIFVNIVEGLAAAALLLGVIGERDELKQRNLTLAFVGVVFLILGINRPF